MPKAGSGYDRERRIVPLCDGVRTSKEIAAILGENVKYVQSTMLKLDLPRKRRGAECGEDNHQYKTGRRIDRDGYVLISAPYGHPNARRVPSRKYSVILEHRLVMETALGRYLHPKEVVDHIDGLHLHNCPSNLRVFESNADHLRATLSGKVPKWSEEGRQKLQLPNSEGKALKLIDTHDQRKKSGDVRLQQILLAALKLGIESPYLLGTHHHLEKAEISDLSRSSLERALDDLYQRYA